MSDSRSPAKAGAQPEAKDWTAAFAGEQPGSAS
jgi:hypothetical protein